MEIVEHNLNVNVRYYSKKPNYNVIRKLDFS